MGLSRSEARRPATGSHKYDRLVWSDELSGPAGRAPGRGKWEAVVGGAGWGNHELETDTGSTANASLDGHGHLAVIARHQSHTGADGITRPFTSARLDTAGRFSFTYGRVEARIKIPAGQGLWPGLWAVGDDIATVGWPRSGEIDIMESLGRDPFVNYGTVHGPKAGATDGYAIGHDFVSRVSLASAFHVYGVVWAPGSITWTVDGRPYARVTPHDLPRGSRWPFDRPFYLILDLAVGGDSPGAPDSATRFPARMLVDWVRVYR
jgi:beta-glucanase (GH16 family)